MPKLIARWNPARGVWETDQQAVCEHSAPFLATWPTSGTTRDGVAYELPTSAHRTDGSGSSSSPGLLRTPTAQLAVNGGSQHPDKRKAGGHGPTLADEIEHLLPTPRATDGTKGGPSQRGSSGDMMLPSAVQLLPTPMTSYSARTADEWRAGRPAGNGQVREAIGDLRIIAEELLSNGDRTSPPSDDGNEPSDE